MIELKIPHHLPCNQTRSPAGMMWGSGPSGRRGHGYIKRTGYNVLRWCPILSQEGCSPAHKQSSSSDSGPIESLSGWIKRVSRYGWSWHFTLVDLMAQTVIQQRMIYECMLCSAMRCTGKKERWEEIQIQRRKDKGGLKDHRVRRARMKKTETESRILQLSEL